MSAFVIQLAARFTLNFIFPKARKGVELNPTNFMICGTLGDILLIDETKQLIKSKSIEYHRPE